MIRRPCDVETSADFQRYYLHGWLALLNAKGENQPFTTTGANATDVGGYLLEKTEKEGKPAFTKRTYQTSWEAFKATADFGRPHVGMLHDGPTLVYASSGTERNSSRGLRLDRLAFTDFNKWYLRKLAQSAIPPTHSTRSDIVWEAFNPNYSSLREAYENLTVGRSTGVPLSLHYGAYTLPDSVYPLLAYKRWTIGHIESPGLVRIHKQFADYAREIEKKLNTGVSVR